RILSPGGPGHPHKGIRRVRVGVRVRVRSGQSYSYSYSYSSFRRYAPTGDWQKGGGDVDRVRIGIIGAGMIAHRSHAEAFQMVPEAEVVAVADVDGTRAKALAEKYGIPQVFSSYEELLARAGVDAVSVALPVFLHAPATIA